MALSQNGTRHAQVYLASSGIETNGIITSEAKISPPCVPVSVHDVKNDRRLSGACSRVRELAPACSPAAEKPCNSRHSTSSAGAAQPMVAKLGRHPMRNVDAPMSTSVNISTRRRPSRSPKWPRMNAPTGRATYAKPNVANDMTSAASSPEGKNTFGKISAAAVPYRKKS